VFTQLTVNMEHLDLLIILESIVFYLPTPTKRVIVGTLVRVGILT